ncbi:MAG: hypothetical protein U5N26_08205 [Candidatus Marinimicrobia bacterium]|nr:hypothetical protein [Candidatus Neomarinimicrobiota bacterium]
MKRDEDGQLSGLLHEEALSVLLDPLLKTRHPGIFAEPGKYFADFYRHGITSVHTMEHFEDYQKYLSRISMNISGDLGWASMCTIRTARRSLHRTSGTAGEAPGCVSWG